MDRFPSKAGPIFMVGVSVVALLLVGGCGGDDGNGPGDVVPPVITVGPTVREITAHSASVLWETDELSNSTVFWSVDTVGSWTEVVDSEAVTRHHVAITGLNSETRYYYRVRSKDAAGNESGLSVLGFFDTFGTSPTLVIEPWEVTVAVGDTLDLAVRVLNVNELFGAAFDVLVPRDLVGLDADTLSAGSFLGDDTETLWFYESGKDLLEVAMSRLRPAGGVDGDGTLMWVHLKAEAVGASEIGFRTGSVRLTDPTGAAIPGLGGLVMVESTITVE